MSIAGGRDKKHQSGTGVFCYLFCLLNDLCKRIRRGLCDVGEHLAVKLDIRFFQPVDELAVCGAKISDGGVDLRLPQGAVIALLFLASAERVRPCVQERFFCGPFFRLAAPAETFGVGQQFFSFLVGGYASLYSCHKK